VSRTALIVCAAPVAGTDEILRACAPIADLLIAVDGGAGVCVAAGYRPDLVVGDLDSLDVAVATELRSRGVEFVVFPVLKDETDLDLALQQARARGCTEVTITGAFSGRLDHTLAAIGTVARAADLRPVIREPHQTGWMLSADHRDALRVTPKGTTFSVLAITSAATVSISGSHWQLDHAKLGALQSVGVSNTVVGGAGTVHVHSGVALVWTPLTG